MVSLVSRIDSPAKLRALSLSFFNNNLFECHGFIHSLN